MENFEINQLEKLETGMYKLSESFSIPFLVAIIFFTREYIKMLLNVLQ